MARAIGVDYALQNAALTMKFKDLPGIDTVTITETQLLALEARSINTFTLIGNNARTYRNGVMSAANWYIDTRINLDNYVNELQTQVFNVFLQQPKVPYTPTGQAMLCQAAALISNNYVYNGTFADRQLDDPQSQAGFTIAPAYTITPTPIYRSTDSDRAARIAPPISILAYLSGAIHSVLVNVNVNQ
jgi:hypothetical protein